MTVTNNIIAAITFGCLIALFFQSHKLLLLGWHDKPPRQKLLTALEKLREAGKIDKTPFNEKIEWTYFYLYVLLDIFSRYVVGWMVAERENSALAGRLIEETCHKQGVQPQVLTLHSDRGAPMTSKCTAQLLADLGITRSLSRPQVSDDNPFSEAQFKTLKYHPGFPARFADQDDATGFCRTFFPWYNTEHRHGGIALLTPDDVHHGRVETVLAQRQRTLEAACATHPERFVRGSPVLQSLPEAVWINPPTEPANSGEIAQ